VEEDTSEYSTSLGIAIAPTKTGFSKGSSRDLLPWYISNTASITKALHILAVIEYGSRIVLESLDEYQRASRREVLILPPMLLTYFTLLIANRLEGDIKLDFEKCGKLTGHSTLQITSLENDKHIQKVFKGRRRAHEFRGSGFRRQNSE
jgi:hypothetical protein